MNYLGSGYGFGLALHPALDVGLAVLILWSILWKGLALWRSAKRGDKVWFIVFLIVNTAGILEIIYLFFVTGAKISDFTSGWSSKQNKNG